MIIIGNILNYFLHWDFMRWFRLFTGILMLAGAAYYKQFLPLIIGGIFLFQAFTNTGCCTNKHCEIPSKPDKKEK